MLSSKRFAQLGLGAAAIVFIGSVFVLLVNAADVPASVAHASTGSQLAGERQIAVVPTGQIGSATLLAKR